MRITIQQDFLHNFHAIWLDNTLISIYYLNSPEMRFGKSEI
jgi:hypothetical protein